MIRHIVLFRLKSGVDEQTITTHMDDFRALAGRVEAIQQIDVRRDIVGRDVSAHFGLIVTFADEAALKVYGAHADHQAAFGRLKANLDRMLVLDFVEAPDVDG